MQPIGLSLNPTSSQPRCVFFQPSRTFIGVVSLVLLAGGLAGGLTGCTIRAGSDSSSATHRAAPGQVAEQGTEEAIPAAIEYPPAPEPYARIVPGTDRELEMVGVPGGTITLADPADPAHPDDPTQTRTVEIAPFWIAKYEITWDFYDPFVFEDMEAGHETAGDADAFARPSKPYIPPDLDFGHEGYPVISVSFHAAEQFCKWLSQRTGETYRLPTEAEWEWACRAGSTGVYSFGDDPAMLGAYAWFEDNSDFMTHPVGEKKPNAWGLYDMHGNAGEWTVDLSGKPVIRGGSQTHDAAQAASAARLYQTSAWNATDPQIPKSPWWLSDCPFGGFRVIRVVD